MNKQNQFSYFSISLILISSLSLITPIRSNAGETVVNGTSIDSSTFSGDSFSPETNNILLTPGSDTPGSDAPGPDTNLFVENPEQDIPLLMAQEQLNRAAQIIIDDKNYSLGGSSNVPSSVLEIILAAPRANFVSNQFNFSLQELGIPRGLVNKLVTNLRGLFKISNSNLKNNHVKNASKDLLENTSLTNQKSLIYVDVNQLNDAIKAHNNIILKSNNTTLQKIAKNPDLLKINQILKDLRNSIDQANLLQPQI